MLPAPCGKTRMPVWPPKELLLGLPDAPDEERPEPSSGPFVHKDDLLPAVTGWLADMLEMSDSQGRVKVAEAHAALLKWLGLKKFKPD